jgi:steroid delta-isomerase-like uncharacterized protein
MTRKEITDFLARRDEAWQRHDIETLTANHTEDCGLESPVALSTKGRNAIRNNYKSWFASFPDAGYSVERLVIDGNQAVQFVKMFGIHKGDFCGLAPTGKRFEVRCAFLFIFADGAIAHETRIYDFTGLLLQLGVLRAKPAF